MSKYKISLVTAYRKNFKILDDYFRSLKEFPPSVEVEHIIVNNNNPQDYENPDVDFKLVHTGKDACFSEVFNLGRKAASGEIIVLLNNDLEFRTPNWDERLIALHEDGVDLVHPLVVNGGFLGNIFENYVDTDEPHYRVMDEPFLGLFLSFKRDESIWLDEGYTGLYHDDVDFSKQFLSEGKVIAVANNIALFHLGGTEMNLFRQSRDLLISHNRDLYVKKWGRVDPGV